MTLLDLLYLLVVVIAAALAGAFLFLLGRIHDARERAAQVRLELMALVRLLEVRFRVANWETTAMQLRSQFPDYFPPEVGGYQLDDEYQLKDERHAEPA